MAEIIHLTNQQARRYLLKKQGLFGAHKYVGKAGALDYIREVGSVQFDPVDVCGKNAEIVLASRVAGFTKRMYHALLYEDRALVDWFDKNLCILPVEDWPYFERIRRAYRGYTRGANEVAAVREDVRAAIRARGALSSQDLDYGDKIDWYWSSTRLSRAALERMYFCGELAIHHKKGSIKYYDLIENCLPEAIVNAPEPFVEDAAHFAWRVERRIGAVGFLWNRASDAWLGIDNMKAAERSRAFSRLIDEGRIVESTVEGIREPLYCRARDAELARGVADDTETSDRCEFLAPLDSLLWDRKLIKALFGFDYKWEIYTPPEQRKYAHYVLPVLAGERFIGRIELVRDKAKNGLVIKNLWYEDGVRPTKALYKRIEACAKRLGQAVAKKQED